MRKRRHREVPPTAQAHRGIGTSAEGLIFPSYPSLLDWANSAWLGFGDSRVREQTQLPTFLFLFQKTKSFTRVVDGFFFPDEPLELLIQKAFNSVPSIIGVNNHECGFLLPVVRILPASSLAPSTVRQGFASFVGPSLGCGGL